MTDFIVRAEARAAAWLQAFLNPRMWPWIVLTVLLGLFLYFVVGRPAAIGSLAVTVFNMSALGYLGYRAANALERDRRPHELFAEAQGLRKPQPTADDICGQRTPTAADLERAWQLEQLADSMLKRRHQLVAACILGATLMKF